MYKRLLIIFILSANLILLISCADDQARSDIADTNNKLSQIQSKISVINTKMTNQKMIDIINKQDELQNQINQLNNQYSMLSGQIKANQDVNSHLLQGIQQQIDGLTKQKQQITSNNTVLDSPNQQSKEDKNSIIEEKYEQSKLDIKSNNFKTAIIKLRDLITNYDSENIYVINAHYFLSVAYAALGKFNEAIETANNFVDNHPDNQYAPDALMTIYICQNQLGNKNKVKQIQKLILDKYPDSQVAKKLKDY